ncbi:hypothetical protein I600_350 [Maribacter dokdonensis DSW-8]|nr:hypothetical protein I600_350 [Maribacter dokdonensis DSW-8]
MPLKRGIFHLIHSKTLFFTKTSIFTTKVKQGSVLNFVVDKNNSSSYT